MTQFIQIHFLTAYPPSNLNRDDLGRPKTAYVGGSNRLRISSQSLKRAWRTSDLFESALKNHIGVRTKRIGIEIHNKFINAGIDKKEAREWTKKIASQFGKLKEQDKKQDTDRQKNQDLEVEQLVHFGPEELNAINELITRCIKKQAAPEEPDLKLLRKVTTGADLACFGRMLANASDFNIEGAVQVAHAITTHAIDVEDDYFIAVDDLNSGVEDAGAAHIGEAEFGSGVFYGYICINRDLLKQNLNDDEILTQKTIGALIECVAKISPTGKQNSFASRAYTSYLLVEKGTQQPRSLAVAFLQSVSKTPVLENSIMELEGQRTNIDKVYGTCYDSEYKLNTCNGIGTLVELISFSISESQNEVAQKTVAVE